MSKQQVYEVWMPSQEWEDKMPTPFGVDLGEPVGEIIIDVEGIPGYEWDNAAAMAAREMYPGYCHIQRK